ncbi:MAG: hypothetical protein CME96_10995 [Hyphomonas sp.]|nr:hypothetical protein [Hyphomonas sp.]
MVLMVTGYILIKIIFPFLECNLQTLWIMFLINLGVISVKKLKLQLVNLVQVLLQCLQDQKVS